MATLTVNYATLGRGTIIEHELGLFPNGYAHELADLEHDTILGDTPAQPLGIMPAGERKRLVVEQLDADAAAYRATADAAEHPDDVDQAHARADEIQAVIDQHN